MNLNTKIYCPVRRTWVEALPEEKVRQELVYRMIDELGFPIECLAVEKALHQMPHLAGKDLSKLPLRRADIVCFASGIHPEYPLYPLVLIECKAIKMTPSTLLQIFGYHHHICSFFIAVANQEEVHTGWMDHSKNEYQFVPYLPSYKDLIQATFKK